MSITHTFVSAISDGSDATQVQPSNWNAAHKIATPSALNSATGVLLGIDAAGSLTLDGVKAASAYLTLRRNAANSAYEFALVDTIKTPSGIGASDIGILLGTDDGSGNSSISGLSSSAALQFLRRKGNVSSKTYEFAGFDNRRAIDYNFTAVSISQNLTSGITNTVTLPFGILGIAGTNTKHYIRINDTVGTSETVKISGGTATSGVAGTLTFKCAFAHTSGNWTLESCTYGGAEAQWTLSSNGGIVEFPAGTLIFKGPFEARGLPIWFRGQGKDATIVSIDTASSPSTIDSVTVTGGINYTTTSGTYSEAGIISDLAIKFVQPDVTTPGSMTSYFPGIYFQDASHLNVINVNIECCTTGIKALNINGMSIRNCGVSSFMGHAIDIDKSFDRTDIEGLTVWPFGCTTNQATAFLATTNRMIPIYMGHADAYRITGCVTNTQGGYTADFHLGANGKGASGVISDCWFDGIGNINWAAGTHLMVNCYQLTYDAYNFIAGNHVGSADVRMLNCTNLALGPAGTFPIKFVPTTDTIATDATGVPNLQADNCKFKIYALDIPVCQVQSQIGAARLLTASFNNCRIERNQNLTSVQGLFTHSASLGSAGSDIIFNVTNCSTTEVGSGAAVFCILSTDIAHNFQSNNCGGTSFSLAGSVNTVWRNNVNALLNYHRFQEEIKLANGTASALAGAATLSKQAGVITSEALTTAAAGTYTLTLTNTKVATTSMCFASVCFGTSTTGTPQIVNTTPTANTLTIIVKNIHASAVFNGTIKISFFVLNI